MLFPSRRGRPRHAAVPRALAAGAAAALLLSACAADEPDAEPTATDEGEVEPLSVVATTSILGDIVEELLGDQGDVTVLMGPGVDPHGYEPSARDGATMREADLVVANGLQLEESLIDTLAAVEEDGVEVFELAPGLDPIDFDFDGDHGHAHGDDDHGHDEDEGHGHEGEDDDHGHGHDDDDGHGHDDEGDEHGHGHDDEDGHGHEDDDHGHEDDDHGHGHDDDGHDDDADGHGHDEDDDHGHEDDADGHGHDDDDDHGHAHGPDDPHVWFDPVRMVDGVELLSAALIDAGDLDAEPIEERTASYIAEIEAIHAELEEAFAATEDVEDRVAVTNHDALGYLAHRYDFEVVGTVIPGASTQAETDARQFSELIETVEEFGISTVFAENTDSTVLAEQLASEVVGRSDLEVEVVRIATDALDEPGSDADTYLGLLRSTGLAVASSFE